MFQLPELQYNYDAFEPIIDAKTMEIHHSKHHQTYVDNLNVAWSDLEKVAPSFAKMPLSEVLKFENLEKLQDFLVNSQNDLSLVNKILNNGGGHLNHSLFWQILKPAGEGENLPSEEFLAIIEEKFNTFEDFKAIFKQEALGRFGSGWAWLRVDENGELVISSTQNQEFYDFEDSQPILGLDVWEHAYYLNYQNRRADYVDAFWNVVNWGEVEKNYHNVVKKNGVIEGDFEEGRCEICLDDKISRAEIEQDLLEEKLADAEFLMEEFEGLEVVKGENSQKRIIYTDGSANPNPGPGGFAIIENGVPIFLGGEEDSTNIRMEGLALKKALEILGEGEAEIWTDSEFWINVLTKWAPAWKKSGWKKKSGKIKNLDIVQPLFELFQNSNAEIKWLKGHAGHEFNEMADEWANRAREGERV